MEKEEQVPDLVKAVSHAGRLRVIGVAVRVSFPYPSFTGNDSEGPRT